MRRIAYIYAIVKEENERAIVGCIKAERQILGIAILGSPLTFSEVISVKEKLQACAS
jgi:hypothetical protein